MLRSDLRKRRANVGGAYSEVPRTREFARSTSTVACLWAGPPRTAIYIRRTNTGIMKASHWLIGGAVILMGACKKEPGVGGKAEIRGHVFETPWDDNTNQPAGPGYFVGDHKVYIVYGDNDYFDDDVDTDPNGLFVYSWLRKGTYRLFTYSECPTCPGEVEVFSKTVEVGDNKEVLDVGTFEVEKW